MVFLAWQAETFNIRTTVLDNIRNIFKEDPLDNVRNILK